MSPRPGASRSMRSRGSRLYGKPPLGLPALVERLAERGLVVADEARDRRYLQHIGYYRLSPYTIPFQLAGPDHRFREGTQFDEVLGLYAFDRSLCLLVMDALERVEIAVRAALTDHMSTTYDDPHWYLAAERFFDTDRHEGLLRIVRTSCDVQLRSAPEPDGDSLVHRSALEHYLTTYGRPELPPSWLMVESLTIGQLAGTYRNLGKRADKTAIARSLGLTAPVLESWLQTYVRVRNICAHHGRLWNVGLGVYPAIPTSPTIPWLQGQDALPERSRKRLYPVLVSLQSVLHSVSPRSSWAWRLRELLATRPSMNLHGMGVPSDWTTDAFWRQRFVAHPRGGPGPSSP